MADKITCFSPAGVEYANNTKCPNSDSCCQTAEQCRPDRLCESNNDPDILVRALCANYPWTYATCATICTYVDDDYYLPRVRICADGSYCCDNAPTCCMDDQGIFLDEHGVAIGRANETTLATTTSLSSSTTRPTSVPPSISASSTAASIQGWSSSSSTPQPTSAEHPDDDASSGLSQPAKVGVGVGVSLGVLSVAAVVLAWIFWRRRGARGKPQVDPVPQVAAQENENAKEMRGPVELPLSPG